MGNVIMKAQQITYGASNVEKALDDLSVPELIELNKRMDAIDAWKANVHEETYTGSELTIENALALPARSLITEINAIQDLHGYDKPWVGGADRNLLPDTYTAQSASVFGLTVTKVDNGLRFVGVPNWNTQTSQFRAASSSDIATLYADGASSACFLKASNQYINIDSCRVDGNDIIVVANTTATTTNIDFTLEFMMYKGTAPTAFRPYSNICPISGRDSVVLTRSDGDEISEDFTIQLGTTVYGGTLNVTTGEVQITAVKYVFDGGDTDTWNSVSTNVVAKTINGVACDNTKQPFCSLYNVAFTTTWNNIPNMTLWIYVTATDTYIRVRDDINGATAQSFKSFLASNNLELALPLATPQTIQLTPTQLTMLKGYNRITVASGYATIELKALMLGGDN